MKSALTSYLSVTLLLFCGCQSANWLTKSKTTKQRSFAQNPTVREVPWTWGKKKKEAAPESSEMPPEIMAKFNKVKEKSEGKKSALEWLSEGNQQELARDFPGARKAYSEALSVDPVNADAHHRLGILADMQRDYSVAQDHYEAALRQKPHDANLLSDFGYSHQLRGNAHQGERLLLQALDVDPQHKQALRNLGNLYAAQGRRDDALQTFRRLRSEGEAQQLMAQFFPAGREGQPGANQLVSAQNVGENRTAPPMPRDEVDPALLKNMTSQQIFDLMEQRRLEGIRQRQHRDLAEMRPNLPPAQTEAESRESLAGRSPSTPPHREWAAETGSSPGAPHSPQPYSGRTVPPALDNSYLAQGNLPPEANRNPRAEEQPAPEQKFWNGAPLSQRGNANRQAPLNLSARSPEWNPQSQRPGSGADADWNSGGAGNAVSQAPWWGENGQEGSRGQVDPSAYDAGRAGGMNSGSAGPGWNGGHESSPPSSRGTFNPNSLSPQKQAWQLGMSVGPGTMFPATQPERYSDSRPLNGAAAPGPEWSNSVVPGGYQETRVSNQPASGHEQWREAPIDTSPRSPTDSWNPPNMTQWPPGGGEASPRNQDPVIHDPRAPAQGNLPTINPYRGRDNRDIANSSRELPAWNPGPSGPDRSNRGGSGIEPAWYNAPESDPRSRPRSNGANTVPQWPHTPK